MQEYYFKFKKGDIEIELKTDDRSFFEQQVCGWNLNLLNIQTETSKPTTNNEEPTDENNKPLDNVDNFWVEENGFGYPINEETYEDNKRQLKLIEEPKNLESEDIERESQRILNEYKAEIGQEEIKKEEFNQEIENIINETKETESQEESSQNDIHENTDFDTILQESMSQCMDNIQKNRDENFANLIKEKSITEKIDFLITTAYYLEKNQGYETFTLNQINKKLSDNFFDKIDYAVIQDAVENGFAEVVEKDNSVETEYKLTEEYKNFVAERAQNV